MRHRSAIIIFPLLALAAGCSTKQQFSLLTPFESQAVLAERSVVVEVTVKQARRSMEWSLTQPLGNGKYREDALVSVDRVVAGKENASQLKLANYRPITRQEASVFPDGYGIHNSLRLLLAYDSRWGSSYDNLCVVPIGYTPEYNEMMRRFREEQSSAATSQPTAERSDR
jgi:hypothetical protein